MANRNTFNGGSANVPWPNVGMPEGFGDNQARHFKTLYDAASFALRAVAGTANNVTATLDPVLDGGGFVDGMKFTITWAASNTGPMTLALNGGAAISILEAEGSAMVAGSAKLGARAMLEYISGSFRVIGGGAGGGQADPYYREITASTTWSKPEGYADDAMVEIEAWGGGGSGGRSSGASGVYGGGGGGGAYVKRSMRYADVPFTLPITIGSGGAGVSGGANGIAGGITTVGALVTAYGGAGGRSVSGTTSGGGGGGESGAPNASTGGPSGGGNAGADGARSIWGGGGGGNGTLVTGAALAGGNAVFGGGGGGGAAGNAGAAPAGGVSLFGGSGGAGGAGGASPTAGAAPGGGGGGAHSFATSGAGARGQVRIRIYG